MKTRTHRKLALILILGVLMTTLLAAQVPDLDTLLGASVRIRTISGALYQGTILGVTDDRVELLVPEGEIILVARTHLESVTQIVASEDGRTFYEDSASNRLVIMPTGFPMDTGEFQVAAQEIIAVTGSYGINDWLSVWGGVSIPGAVFSLRASTHIGDSAGISAGTFVGASWFDLSLGPLVMPYALASFGEEDNNLTLGSGFMMTFSDGFSIPGAVLAIGGKKTLTSTTAIVTENWIVWTQRGQYNPADDTYQEFWSVVPLVVAPSVVFRIANNRLSWDIGAVVPFIIQNNSVSSYYLNDPIFPIPILSLTYRIR